MTQTPTRRQIAPVWAVPIIAVGTPAPALAASCRMGVKLCSVQGGRDGKVRLTLEVTADTARTIAWVPGGGWTVSPTTSSVPPGTSTVTLTARGGRQKAFALSWVTAGACRMAGCLTVDTRRN